MEFPCSKREFLRYKKFNNERVSVVKWFVIKECILARGCCLKNYFIKMRFWFTSLCSASEVAVLLLLKTSFNFWFIIFRWRHFHSIIRGIFECVQIAEFTFEILMDWGWILFYRVLFIMIYSIFFSLYIALCEMTK